MVLPRADDVVPGHGSGRGPHQLDEGAGRSDEAIRAAGHLPQLHRGRRHGTGARHVRPALGPPRRAEGSLRPGQPVPAQPEHPALGGLIYRATSVATWGAASRRWLLFALTRLT